MIFFYECFSIKVREQIANPNIVCEATLEVLKDESELNRKITM